MTTEVQNRPETMIPEDMHDPLSQEEAYAQSYKRAKQRVEEVRGFFGHLAAYLAVNTFLFLLNMITSPDSLWFYWPLMGWGIAVAMHFVSTFGPSSLLGRRWEERKIREYMEKDRL